MQCRAADRRDFEIEGWGFSCSGSSIARSAIVHAEISWVNDQGQSFNLVVAAIKGVGKIRARPLSWRRTTDYRNAHGTSRPSKGLGAVVHVCSASDAGIVELRDAHLEANDLIGDDVGLG